MIGAHALTTRAGITYRQLDFWTRAGYLTAADRSPWERAGYPREYPVDQIPLAVWMGRLTRAGIPARVAHDAALQIIDTGHARLGNFDLLPIVLPREESA